MLNNLLSKLSSNNRISLSISVMAEVTKYIQQYRKQYTAINNTFVTGYHKILVKVFKTILSYIFSLK